MDIKEVKAALGKQVRFKNIRLHCNGIYTLTGCTIRLSPLGRFFYQAEIQDTRQQRSVSIVDLKEIELEGTGGKENGT